MHTEPGYVLGETVSFLWRAGLGLFLVQRLVRLAGGRVEASSDGPGRGAQFCVRLPRATEAP